MLPAMPLRSKLHAALIGVALIAGGLAGPLRAATAADVGVNVTPTSGDYSTSAAVEASIDALHPAWVRVFMGWNAVETAPGVYNDAVLANYHAFFAGSRPRRR
jgi:hypothetical protein